MSLMEMTGSRTIEGAHVKTTQEPNTYRGMWFVQMCRSMWLVPSRRGFSYKASDAYEDSKHYVVEVMDQK